jgi:hypothetical protein
MLCNYLHNNTKLCGETINENHRAFASSFTHYLRHCCEFAVIWVHNMLQATIVKAIVNELAMDSNVLLFATRMFALPTLPIAVPTVLLVVLYITPRISLLLPVVGLERCNVQHFPSAACIDTHECSSQCKAATGCECSFQVVGWWCDGAYRCWGKSWSMSHLRSHMIQKRLKYMEQQMTGVRSCFAAGFDKATTTYLGG